MIRYISQRKSKERKTPSERLLYFITTISRLPVPVQEYRFDPSRRWRFDFAYPDKKLAIEVEGGVYTGGRHVRIGGFENDAEKYNTAALMGWMVLRFTPKMIDSGLALMQIERAMRSAEKGK